MSIFPTALPDPFSSDPAVNKPLQDALEAAVASVLADWKGTTLVGNYCDQKLVLKTPIAIAQLAPATQGGAPPQHLPFAGIKHTEDFYSASLLKMAALYGAFALVRCAQETLSRLPPPYPASEQDVASALMAQLQGPILSSAPKIARANNISPQTRVPKLWSSPASGPPGDPSVLKITVPTDGGAPTAVMSPDLLKATEAMISVSDDAEAGRCIRAIGYSWISGLLISQRLFTEGNSNNGDGTGIWLAGDYSNEKIAKAVRIHCVNQQQPSAQVTTSIDMARLIAWIGMTSLPDGQSMLNIFTKTIAEGYRFLSCIEGLGFETVASKVGIGEAPDVYSEGLIVKSGESHFVVVWQNLITAAGPVGPLLQRLASFRGTTAAKYSVGSDTSVVAFAPMAMIVDRTIASFLAASSASGAP